MGLYFYIQGDSREKVSAPLIIFGNGPQARVAFSYISTHAEIAAFTVDDFLLPEGEASFEGCPIVPFSQLTARFPSDRYVAIVAVGYKQMNRLRRERAIQLSKLGYRLASYVDPTVRLPRDIEIGANCIVLDQVSLHTGTRIREGAFLSSGCVLGHDCHIEPYCWIGSGCTMAGNVRVGEETFLGLRAGIAELVAIGERCFVGSHAFVSRNLPTRTTILAKPADVLSIDSERFLAMMA